jgi:DNA-binding CsgD family transcriptional regulator
MQANESGQQARLFLALQQLLGLDVVELQAALTQAADVIAGVLRADKVDVFLYESESACLVALGTSRTPMGQRQKALGLDRLSIAEGGTPIQVFQMGRSHLSRHTDREGDERRDLVEGLGIRSQIGVPLVVHGERRGVVMACSAASDYFTEVDLTFLEAVANWVGLVGYRAAMLEQTVADAAQAGIRAAVDDMVGKLTPRQREVAQLVAGGLSNAEIAQQLVLTPGTVANHVEGILRRLGFRSRSQVAALLGGPSGARLTSDRHA